MHPINTVMTRLLRLTVLLLACATSAFAQAAPEQLPARESHSGLLIAVDAYHDAARSKERFGKKHPQAAGILAVEVIFRNDTNRAIWIGLDRIRLILEAPGASRQRLEPMHRAEVVDRLLGKGPPDPTLPRRPLPRRRPSGPDKQWAETEVLISSLELNFDALPPQSTMRGFLFFDLNKRFDRLAHARLYIPELKFIHTGEELMFFEIDLARAAVR